MDVQVKLGSWSEMQALAAPIRMEVFVIEQKVPLEEEIDAIDAHCVHACAFDGQGRVVGTGRLLPDGHIGRMSVLKTYRSAGVGSALLKALTNEAQVRGFLQVVLHAQTHAAGFYTAHGFEQEGEAFDEANIPHVLMRKALSLR